MKPGDLVKIKENAQELREHFMQSKTNVLDFSQCLDKVFSIAAHEGFHTTTGGESFQMVRLKHSDGVILKESGGTVCNIPTDIYEYLMPTKALIPYVEKAES